MVQRTIANHVLKNAYRVINPVSVHRSLGRKALFSSSCSLAQPHRPTMSFYEPDDKAGYRKVPLKGRQWEFIKLGFKHFHKDWKKLFDHMRQSQFPPPLYIGDHRYFAKFREMPDEELENWCVTTDKDHEEGHSTATLERNPRLNTIVMRGNLDINPVKKGDIVRAGYVNLRSPDNFLFGFKRAYNFQPYTHLVVRYRGDGRNYVLQLSMLRDFDVHMFDLYQYPLYSRGGPYWQVAKIPFSKFFLTYRGRVQDKQRSLDLDSVKTLNIGLMGSRPGPFQLELDYIALYYDPLHVEKFAYETFAASSPTKAYY